MNTEEILQQLESYDGTFPRRALEEAVANREQIVPALLRTLEYAEQNAEALLEQEDYMAHIYAMFLLAQFRERQAYPLIARFFRLPGELSLDLTGDVVTEYLDRILASVSGGDTSLMMELAEDEKVNEYVRCAALNGMVTLVACGEKSRDEVMDYFKSLLTNRLKREPHHIWSCLVACCADLYPEEVYEEIKQAFAEELVDETYIDLQNVDEDLKRGKEQTLKNLQESRHQLITDTISEMEGWASFQEPDADRSYKPSLLTDWDSFREMPAPQKPYVAPPKIGRNEPCPCGSGKKYKKCCGG